MVSQYFFYTFRSLYGNCLVDAGIEGQFTNHSLRVTTAWTGGLQKGIPDKFVTERTEHRDVRYFK